NTVIDPHWIDKTVYYVPTINASDLLEIAQYERETLVECYAEECEQLSDWASIHPGINPKRVLSNAFISANVYMQPWQQPSRLTLAKTNMAIFGTDDLYDANDITLEDLQRISDAFAATDDHRVLTAFSDASVCQK